MQRKIRLTPVRFLVLGYLAIILIGAILLVLPPSSKIDGGAPFMDALFTAVSASCVTGLVVHDTYLYWSPLGQIVILVLIQMGGIGFMTVVFAFWKIGRKNRTERAGVHAGIGQRTRCRRNDATDHDYPGRHSDF